MTLREALMEAETRIARRDAETLLLHVLRDAGRNRAWLLAHPEAELNAEHTAHLFRLVDERRRHKPMQYITGHQEFFGLDLQLSPDTLIPRPETELLVEAVLAWVGEEGRSHRQPLSIVDVGTGSGAIALALAAHLPAARMWAVDNSAPVRPIVELNANRLGLADRIRFVESDLLSGLLETAASLPFDAVVSNPPYVASTDAESLEAQVRDFEPHTALFAGPDGLAVYRRLIPQAWTALKPGGLLALEFGFGQRDALRELLHDWQQVRFLDDLAGIPRVALAERP